MTADQIAEMFVSAAEIEAKLPGVKGLREQWGGYSLAWVHDRADINMRIREFGDKLLPGDNPIDEWARGVSRVLSEWERKAKSMQVGNWEACLDISLQFIPNAKHRRALWAWAMSQAGTLRHPNGGRLSFDRWCKEVERVSRWTGYDRKSRAIACLTQQLGGKVDLRAETLQNSALQERPETGHVPATVPGVHEAKPLPTWRDDPAFQSFDISRESRAQFAHRRKMAERRRKAEKVAA